MQKMNIPVQFIPKNLTGSKIIKEKPEEIFLLILRKEIVFASPNSRKVLYLLRG